MDKNFKINNMDLLRLAAASQVLLAHGLQHLHIDRPSWWPLFEKLSGVPIFFVISGYLISASLERSESYRRYFGNRVRRIYPALWCCIALTLVAALLCGYSVFTPATVPWVLSQAAGVIYTPSFLQGFGMGSYNGSLWTIPIELQFYVVLPLLYLVFCRGRASTRGIFAAFVVFIGVAAVMRQTVPGLGLIDGRHQTLVDRLLRYTFLPCFYLFLAGVLLQRWRAHAWRCVRGKGLYWLVGYFAIDLLPLSQEVNHFAGMLVLAMTTVSLAYTAPTLAGRLLRHNDISYGVYIYHGLLMNLFLQAGLAGHWYHLAALAVLSYLAGYLSWVLVERPLLRHKPIAVPSSQHGMPAAAG